jgi:hypothetical protein
VWGNLHFHRRPSSRSVACIDARRFLLESFEPSAAAESSALRLELAADELTREGTAVVYRRTIRLESEETSFHLLDAAREDAVEAAALRAGLALIRVVPADERDPLSG